MKKSQISASVKHPIHQIDGFNFLAVNNFRVYLGRFHIGVSEQLARCIKVCAQCQHHRCEVVPARMIGDMLPDSIPFNIIEDFDLAKYSYLLTFGNGVEKLSYSLYDTFRYDVSPNYCRVCKSGNQLLIVDYLNFTYREKSMYNNASLIGNDSIYIYRLPHLSFLRGLQGL